MRELRHWNRNVNRLVDSLRESGEGYTVSDVRDEIDAGRAQWHGFEEVAVVTQILDRPLGSICIIWLVAGTMAELPSVEDAVADWATAHGCVEMRFTGRRGWLKMLPHWDDLATIGRRRL